MVDTTISLAGSSRACWLAAEPALRSHMDACGERPPPLACFRAIAGEYQSSASSPFPRRVKALCVVDDGSFDVVTSAHVFVSSPP